MVTSETKHLVSMANDISANLAFQADGSERTAEHIKRYWPPRMRGLLLEYAAGGGEGLSTSTLEALDKLEAG
jgi:hypothetical protein